MLKDVLIAKTNAKANDNQIKIIDDIRITVLTSRLIRVEKSHNKQFIDLASMAVWFRKFDAPNFTVKNKSNEIIVTTDDIVLTVNKSSGKPKKVKFVSTNKTVDCYKKSQLKGTRRTLDGTFGKVKMQKALVSENGVSVLDDSDSVLIQDDGMLCGRADKNSDKYVFAYGDDYRKLLKDFYKISSPVPIVPRYALGVWWSRYRAYTQDEYQNLMIKFENEQVPITVATVDMDWHWTDLKKQFNYKKPSNAKPSLWHDGWTGYSWNTDLFPDYKGFLKFLKDKNLHTTLNLHPCDGVRYFEDMYEDVAKEMGVDPKTKQSIDFKCGSDKFWNTYFDYVHKPYEKLGVDFWWIDWQQGKKSDVAGVDPLVALNHYHYLDNSEDGRIPLILSRYSGPGSHRYPLGFSGDTAIKWSVLDFQPYFTSSASNAGYPWWSHDIGGHHLGYKDSNLYVRWLQLGVFSPIMRLHSTSNDLLSKEPWMYPQSICNIAKDFLCLRHKLIPYIYTCDALTHYEGISLCEPMYYTYPKEKLAYNYKNQYMFGSELMVCPITQKQNNKVEMGSVEAWIPHGMWTDIFTNQRYVGPMELELNREMDTIPVLAKEGAIIPLSMDSGNTTNNPKNMQIKVYAGTSSFTLYEDNSQTDFDDHNAKTKFDVKFNNDSHQLKFTINAPVGDMSVLPQNRNYSIVFANIDPCATVIVNGEKQEITTNYNQQLTVNVVSKNQNEKIEIVLENAQLCQTPNHKEEFVRVMSRWQKSTILKSKKYKPFQDLTSKKDLLNQLKKVYLPKEVTSAVTEILLQE